MFNFRPNGLQMTMLLTFEIFGRARNYSKKFPNLDRTSFSGIVNFVQKFGVRLVFLIFNNENFPGNMRMRQ